MHLWIIVQMCQDDDWTVIGYIYKRSLMIYKTKFAYIGFVMYICKTNIDNCKQMDIVSRLKFFLEKEHISNSVFADNCKIARPTLSQLLTGRNKKVSDEIVSKIHEAYPSLSIMWLLFGEGEMYAVSAKNTQSPENSIFGSDLDASSEYGENGESNNLSQNNKVIDFNEDDEAGHDSGQSAIGDSLPEAMRMLVNSNDGSKRNLPQVSGGTGVAGGKKIVSIMVFYSDNSFDTFTPSSK